MDETPTLAYARELPFEPSPFVADESTLKLWRIGGWAALVTSLTIPLGLLAIWSVNMRWTGWDVPLFLGVVGLLLASSIISTLTLRASGTLRIERWHIAKVAAWLGAAVIASTIVLHESARLSLVSRWPHLITIACILLLLSLFHLPSQYRLYVRIAWSVGGSGFAEELNATGPTRVLGEGSLIVTMLTFSVLNVFGIEGVSCVTACFGLMIVQPFFLITCFTALVQHVRLLWAIERMDLSSIEETDDVRS